MKLEKVNQDNAHELSPQEMIACAVDKVAEEQNCEVKPVSGHLDNNKTWMFSLARADGNILSLAEATAVSHSLSDKLNVLGDNYYITVDQVNGLHDAYIKVEPLHN